MPKTSGLLFFLAGTLVVLGITLSEIFYPINYSVSKNFISNLGSTPPPISIIFQPSAGIFDLTLIFAGLMTMIGSWILQKEKKYQFLAWALLATGFGTAGVGFFPAFHASLHPIFALTAFAAGGVAALLAGAATKPPFSFASFAIGVFSLGVLALSLFAAQTLVPIFGSGGAERLVAYPEMLWLIGFGGYLLGIAG